MLTHLNSRRVSDVVVLWSFSLKTSKENCRVCSRNFWLLAVAEAACVCGTCVEKCGFFGRAGLLSAGRACSTMRNQYVFKILTVWVVLGEQSAVNETIIRFFIDRRMHHEAATNRSWLLTKAPLLRLAGVFAVRHRVACKMYFITKACRLVHPDHVVRQRTKGTHTNVIANLFP